MLSIGGAVNFDGAFSSLEGIYLQPASGMPGSDIFQAAAHLTISAQTLALFSSTVELQGTGTITINLAAGDTIDASSFVRAPGSNVVLIFNGSTTNDTITGSTGNDTLDGGNGDDTLYGGAGDDVIRSGSGREGRWRWRR